MSVDVDNVSTRLHDRAVSYLNRFGSYESRMETLLESSDSMLADLQALHFGEGEAAASTVDRPLIGRVIRSGGHMAVETARFAASRAGLALSGAFLRSQMKKDRPSLLDRVNEEGDITLEQSAGYLAIGRMPKRDWIPDQRRPHYDQQTGKFTIPLTITEYRERYGE